MLTAHLGTTEIPSVTLAGSTALAGPITGADVAIKDLGKCLLPSPGRRTPRRERAWRSSAPPRRCWWTTACRCCARTQRRRRRCPRSSWPGPRNKIFFDPRTVGCGIVTCGGLCPGINNVVRGLVLELARGYGVKRILGFRYGYEGLISRFGHEPLALTAGVGRAHPPPGRHDPRLLARLAGRRRGRRQPRGERHQHPVRDRRRRHHPRRHAAHRGDRAPRPQDRRRRRARRRSTTTSISSTAASASRAPTRRRSTSCGARASRRWARGTASAW